MTETPTLQLAPFGQMDTTGVDVPGIATITVSRWVSQCNAIPFAIKRIYAKRMLAADISGDRVASRRDAEKLLHRP